MLNIISSYIFLYFLCVQYIFPSTVQYLQVSLFKDITNTGYMEREYRLSWFLL